MRYRFIISMAVCGALMGCGEQRKKAEEEAEYARKEQEKDNIFVKVQVARRNRFNVERISTGKRKLFRIPGTSYTSSGLHETNLSRNPSPQNGRNFSKFSQNFSGIHLVFSFIFAAMLRQGVREKKE